jgi:hypothetical protein
MTRPAPRLLLTLLALLAATGMVLQAGSVPHLHDDHGAAFYNQEHDLTLLAGLAGHATTPDLAPSLTIDAVFTPLVPITPARPTLRAVGAGDSRAPPSV